MKKIILLSIIILVFVFPVSAVAYEAPEAPQSAEKFLPPESKSFSEDLWYVIQSAIIALRPNLGEALKTCVSLVALVIVISVLQAFYGPTKQIAGIACTVSVAMLLLGSSNTMIQLGTQTVEEISEYGKLFMPVLTGALAAEGGITQSAALYAGTIFFNTLLSAAISKLIAPMIYIYMVLCVANAAVGNAILKGLCDFLKWLMTWSLKIILYTFTGYIGITGVVSGMTDAAALKATKLTVSGMVPVVGGIISEASEAILVSAGIMKNTVGIYGLLVILSLYIGPFLEMGIHYLLLKATGGICAIFGSKDSVDLIKCFSGATGFVLAMTGSVCLMLLISTVCFMKGIS